MQQIGIKYYVYNIVERQMYDIKNGPSFSLSLEPMLNNSAIIRANIEQQIIIIGVIGGHVEQ